MPRLRTDRPVARAIGTAFGIGYCAIGAYSLLGSFDQTDALVRDRAFWFGITAVVVGVVAIAVSWLEERLDLVWCADPRRRARFAPRDDAAPPTGTQTPRD